jgi:hypothetical protein
MNSIILDADTKCASDGPGTEKCLAPRSEGSQVRGVSSNKVRR